MANQVTDDSHPEYGAVINPDWGAADPSHRGSAALVAASVLLRLASEAEDIYVDRSVMMDRATAAADYLLRAQRDSGRIDLRDCNYDSGPDTAFVVQLLCAVLGVARSLPNSDNQWVILRQKMRDFLRKAARGVISGGFHTPNHRWVIASALALAESIFPEIQAKATVSSYLSEGLDIDEDGAYLERSAGVYDAVCNRSLLLLLEIHEFPEVLAAVVRNLDFNLHLLNADGTIETGLSCRQDYGKRSVPLGLAMPYVYSTHFRPDPLFIKAAEFLWENATDPHLNDVTWLLYAILKSPEPLISEGQLPSDFSRFFAANGFWRVRKYDLSASVFSGASRLMTLKCADAELSAMKISASYFGQGQFIGDQFQVEDGKGVLVSNGDHNPRRPGYDMPLGAPVAAKDWAAAGQRRRLVSTPPNRSMLEILEMENGFELTLRTVSGTDRVLTQVSFDMPPGGVWETADTTVKPQAGQVLFLKQGTGTMRYGLGRITIGPGACAHTTWQMRDAEPAEAGLVRVNMTFVTPVNHRFSVVGKVGE